MGQRKCRNLPFPTGLSASVVPTGMDRYCTYVDPVTQLRCGTHASWTGVCVNHRKKMQRLIENGAGASRRERCGRPTKKKDQEGQPIPCSAWRGSCAWHPEQQGGR